MMRKATIKNAGGALVSGAALACVGMATTVAAQEQNAFVYGSVLGDVDQSSTSNPGRVHFGGNLGASNADYFRGRFDGVAADLDAFALGPDLSATFELWQDEAAPLSDLSLTLGTQNDLTTDEERPTAGELDPWYESNNFAALTAGFGDWLAGLTYTVYGSPNDTAGTAHEVALATSYDADNLVGRLSPQAKLAVPVDEGDGAFAQLTAGPSTTVFQDSDYPLTLGLPVTLGVGFADYYGPDTDVTGYVDVGVSASVPLSFIPSQAGSWTLTAGLDALLRDQRVVEAGGAFDENDNFVPLATVAVSFVY